MRRLQLAVIGLLLAGSGLAAAFAQGESPASSKPVIGNWGFDLAGMDRKVKPGDDFFRYANGAWFDQAVIPSDRPMTGGFVDLDIQSEDRVRAILNDLEMRRDRLSAEEEKVADLYKSYVDTAHLEELGLAPAKKDLETIASLKTHEDIVRIMGSVGLQEQSIVRAGIGPDDKNPDAYAVNLRQSGLGLPDRDYYLIDEKGTVAARGAYRPYIAQILSLGGIPDADAKAGRIFALETEIAKLHWTRAERRDAEKTYNPMTVSELAAFAPGFPWAVYLHERGIVDPPGGERRVIVSEKSAFPGLAALFAATPVDVWKDYLTFHYLSGHADELTKRFDAARFDFYGKVLAGQKEELAREKRGVRFLSGMIGEGVGKIYVDRYFPADAKAKAQDLVRNLLSVYRQRIEAADWMSPETRAQALAKVSNFTVKIGYPDKWRDYTKLEVEAGDLLGNQERGALFNWKRNLIRLDDKVDRGEWGMTPQTVNAYYNESWNEIVFPAAILQPPFFDPKADDAVNYGAIGAVIGHEISHGFDDQGSKYNAKGVLENWWTGEDRKNFDARTTNLAMQYNAFSPVPGMFVNGKLTLGENIADLSGLTVAESAYHLSLKGNEPPVIDGFTGEQRLFLGFAQVWRFKAREETARQRVLTDPHSPPEFRVNGTVRNVDAWYEAMGVKSGDKLYLAPEARVHLW
jgi:putative endopeptidase